MIQRFDRFDVVSSHRFRELLRLAVGGFVVCRVRRLRLISCRLLLFFWQVFDGAFPCSARPGGCRAARVPPAVMLERWG